MLPPELASFQARSAFTGAGFTTVESENVVNQPGCEVLGSQWVRRRVIGTTMLVGNLGTPTLIVTVIIGLAGPGPGDTPERLLATVIGLFVVLVLLRVPPVTRALVRVGAGYARRRLLPAVGGDPVELLDLGGGNVVAEIWVTSPPELGPRSIRGLDAALVGLKLLGVRQITRDGVLLAEPPADLDLAVGDSLVVFGPREDVDILAAVVTWLEGWPNPPLPHASSGSARAPGSSRRDVPSVTARHLALLLDRHG